MCTSAPASTTEGAARRGSRSVLLVSPSAVVPLLSGKKRLAKRISSGQLNRTRVFVSIARHGEPHEPRRTACGMARRRCRSGGCRGWCCGGGGGPDHRARRWSSRRCTSSRSGVHRRRARRRDSHARAGRLSGASDLRAIGPGTCAHAGRRPGHAPALRHETSALSDGHHPVPRLGHVSRRRGHPQLKHSRGLGVVGGPRLVVRAGAAAPAAATTMVAARSTGCRRSAGARPSAVRRGRT